MADLSGDFQFIQVIFDSISRDSDRLGQSLACDSRGRPKQNYDFFLGSFLFSRNDPHVLC